MVPLWLILYSLAKAPDRPNTEVEEDLGRDDWMSDQDWKASKKLSESSDLHRCFLVKLAVKLTGHGCLTYGECEV